METVRRSRACSLTFCGPRGRDFPEPATGKRQRDAGGAGAIAPAPFAAKSHCVRRMAIERLGRQNSIASGQFSMTNSQSALAGSDPFRNALAPKALVKPEQRL